MRKQRKKTGFTIIELLVTVITGLIVLLAAGTVVVAGQRFWSQAYAKASIQRDASLAMLTIKTAVQDGHFAQVESEGDAVKIFYDSGWVRFSIDRDAGLLVKLTDTGALATVVENVQDAEFAVNARTVDINIDLAVEIFESNFVSSATIRNYDPSIQN